jgi:hypothetical protein
MENKNLPELQSPMINMLDGNMPGLPEVIRNSMPVEMPRASFQENSFSLFFGNMKRKQLVKSMKAEAEIAEYSRQAVHSKLEMVTDLVTCSSRLADTMGVYEHNKNMRRITEEEGSARVALLKLEADEKKANIQQMTYQTALIAQEVEMAKVDHKIKLKQLKEILEEA